MEHGDSEQTLRVFVAYYRQKTEILGDDIRDKAPFIESKCISRGTYHEFHNTIQSEFCSKQTIFLYNK